MYSNCDSCQSLKKLEFSWQIFKQCYENLSIGSRVVPCERKDRRTQMTKLIFALCNCSKMPKNEPFFMTNNCTIQSFLSCLVTNISRPQTVKWLAASCCYHEAEQCCGQHTSTQDVPILPQYQLCTTAVENLIIHTVRILIPPPHEIPCHFQHLS